MAEKVEKGVGDTRTAILQIEVELKSRTRPSPSR
jgi:hypothetical protein